MINNKSDINTLIKSGMFNICGIYKGVNGVTHPVIYLKRRIEKILDLKTK